MCDNVASMYVYVCVLSSNEPFRVSGVQRFGGGEMMGENDGDTKQPGLLD